MLNLKKTALALLLSVSLITMSVPVGATTVSVNDVSNVKKAETKNNSTTSEEKETRYAEGEAIILYNNNATTAKTFSNENALGADITIKETYDFSESTSTASTKSNSATGENGISVSVVTSDKYSTEELIAKLKKRSDIKYAEPNYKIKALDLDEDTYKKYQWNLDNTGQNGGTEGLDINADTQALQTSINNEEKVIALVDTGMDYTHEDLQGIVWNNPFQSKKLKGEHGYDFVNYDGDPMDDYGHGTHCAGIMAANSNNGLGIAGTADSENIKIMALKILDENGAGYTAQGIAAYNYIYKAQQMGVNVVAVNNSWGAEGDEDETLEIFPEVINLVGKAGALSVCAAGNSGESNDEINEIPANLDSPYIISVAASNEKDELASFSNYGTNVDIAAPGTNILSTVSYNKFNPILYENKDELCSLYQNFENGNLVQIYKNGKLTETEIDEDDIGYGFDSTRKAQMSVELTEDTYFGVKSENAKSLKWTIKNAKEEETYTLYLPYTAEVSSTPLYSSIFAKAFGPAGSEDDIWGISQSIVYISDGQIVNGSYDMDTETILAADTVEENKNYWVFGSKQVESSISEKQNRAISVQITAESDGDYTIYLDEFGVSKPDVEESSFGKYDFYNGTSMATPAVTAAVALVADSLDDATALERKARILGSVRKNANFDNAVNTGGVMDLSRVETPSMVVDTVDINADNQIEIQGYYLTDATIKIDGQEMTPIEQSDNKITIDGASYINKYITIEMTKDDQTFTKKYFFMNNNKFNQEKQKLEGYLQGGSLTTDGGSMYYVNDIGDVYVGTPVEYDDTTQITWIDYGVEYDAKLFGDSYNTTVEYSLQTSDIICSNKQIYALLSIDVGYSEDSIVARYDSEKGWQKYADVPDDIEEFQGVTIGSYNGKIYLIGGYDEDAGVCSKQVKTYDEEQKEWIACAELPQERCYSKAVQVGDKLVVTLGGNGKDTNIKNLIFDGSAWTESKADLGNVVETDLMYYVTNSGEQFPYLYAQTGMVKNGIVYTDLKVEGLGDTFIYNLKDDKYSGLEYSLNSDSLDGDQLVATTVQDKLYVLYGESYVEDDWYYDLWKMDKSAALSILDSDWGLDLDYGDINVCDIPIDSGFINVTDSSDIDSYVIGSGYYLPGDTIKLEAGTFDDGYITSFKVDGTLIKADSKGKYTYETIAGGDVYTINAAATSGTYVSEVFMEDETLILKPAESFNVYAEIFPENATNQKLKWTSSNTKVAKVSSKGKVTVQKNAKEGQSAVIRATATDRGTVYGECTVIVSSSGVSVKDTVKSGKFTYEVTGTKAGKKTVTCVKINNKNATKATVPATIKINGEKYKVTKIAANAFKNCKKLKAVTVGKNITSIGKNAWKGCSKLKKVTIKAKKISSFGKGMLKGTNKKIVVKVPKKSKKAYKAKLKKAGFSGTVK